MHFNFSTSETLWTLNFAAVLVLLVALLGRDRVRRFPVFTASIVLTGLRMLAGHLLIHRLPQVLLEEIFLGLAVASAIASLLLVVEIARRAFAGLGRREWIAATAALLAVGAGVLAFWGPWPNSKSFFAASGVLVLRLLQLFAEKADLLSEVLIILLGVLVVIFGRYFKSSWHSHVQQIVIGLSMAAIAQLAIHTTLQNIAQHTVIHTPDDYKRVFSLINSLQNANMVIFLVVMIWWIICLWIDEPGAAAAESEEQTADSE